MCAALEAATGVSCRRRTNEICRTIIVDALVEGAVTRAALVVIPEAQCFSNDPEKPILGVLAAGRELATAGWGPLFVPLASWKKLKTSAAREAYMAQRYRASIHQAREAMDADEGGEHSTLFDDVETM